MGRLHEAFDTIFPGYETLREQANATMRDVEVEPGKFVEIPFYDQDVGLPILVAEEPFVTKRSKRELGVTATFVTFVDGIRHVTDVRVPYDDIRADNGPHEFLEVVSTPWLTSRRYDKDRGARSFATDLMPQVINGPPFDVSPQSRLSDVCDVPATIAKVSALPLSYTAQAEQAIIAAIDEAHPYLHLPKRQVKLGDSRGANVSPGHIAYALMHNAEVFAFDNKGRAAPDKIELSELPAFMKWIAMTGLGGVAAAACLIKDGKAGTLLEASSLDPNFLAVNMTGTMRALASGETGAMLHWVPDGIHGSELLFGKDGLSKAEQTSRFWQSYKGVNVKVVPGGTHGALIHPLAPSGQVERMCRLAQQYRRHHGIVGSINYGHVYRAEEAEIFEQAA